VHELVQELEAILRPVETVDLSRLVRTFTLRASDGFVETFGPDLIARIGREAPGVRLYFVQKPDKDSTPLRDGLVDLETGIVERALGPEVRTQGLFRDRLVGVVRPGHPLTAGEITASRYARAGHVVVSRTGLEGSVDDPFLPPDLKRNVSVVVSGFSAALALARTSDLVATVPERHTAPLRLGMFCFGVPAPPRPFTVSMLWHPRLDADPAHRWLRACVREVCASA
jgi:DNA-binding transcriptional LysR family regulator